MSKVISDYLYDLAKNSNINDIKVIAFRACYTKYLHDITNILKNNTKFKDKMIEEILKTHKKINNLIESFNKDTNYKFKKVFENRNNYCNEETCDLCKHGDIISCINAKIYLYAGITPFDVEAYKKLMNHINNELVEFTNQKLT